MSFVTKVIKAAAEKKIFFEFFLKKISNILQNYYNFAKSNFVIVMEWLYVIFWSNFKNLFLYKYVQSKVNDYDNSHLSLQNEKILDPKFAKNFSNNNLIKQNKALTKYETVSYIISSSSNRSYFYSPLHSYLPLFISGVVFSILIILVALFFRDLGIQNKGFLLFLFVFSLAVSLSFWFSKFYLEKKTGNHIGFIRHNIVLGFYLFITTEGLCFLALFWTFLHSTLAASIHIGVFNPGEGVVNFYISESYRISKFWNIYYYNTFGTSSFYNVSTLYFVTDLELFKYNKVKTHVNLFDSGSLINPWKLPFINTLILLSSAASLNASHCYMLLSKYIKCLVSLFITIIFGLLFVMMQFKEYKNCSLNYNDGIYPSCFFGITGLHGIHVILGIIALIICLFNIFLKNYSPNFHQTFYFSIFYWHFVDIIWIAVWLIIYLWPGSYFFVDQYLSCYNKDLFVYNMNTDYFLNLIDYNAWGVFYEFDNTLYNKKNQNLEIILQTFDDFFKVYSNNSYKISIDWSLIYNSFLKGQYFKLDDYLYLEFSYSFFLENKQYFNFNLIKKNILYYCVFMTEVHDELVLSVYCPAHNDITNKYTRWLIYLYMDLLMPRFLLYIYLNFFFSPWYFYNIS